MTLTEFILARIADREQVARDLANWTTWEVPIFRLFDDDPESQADLDAKDYAKVFAQLMRAHEVPARELAQCAAIRRIVEEWRVDLDLGVEEPNQRWAVKVLAQPYADHPDFDPAWRLT